MVILTQQQIKTLTGEKCPECMGIDEFVRPYIHCKSCNGTGLPTIEIEKEWVECKICNGQGGWYMGNEETGEGDCQDCQDCKGKGEIPKYKVGDIIYIHKPTGKEVIGLKPTEYYEDEIVKLKIISETKDKQKIQVVR